MNKTNKLRFYCTNWD